MRDLYFAGYPCTLEWRRYTNGRPALLLIDSTTDGEEVAVASVNLPDIELEPDEICIKDYSENEGMLSALVTAGIVEKPHRFERSGFVTIPICRLRVTPGN